MTHRDEPSAVEGRLIQARYEVLSSVWGDVPKLYNHAVLAQLSLPLRSQPGRRFFSRTSGKCSLQLEAGSLPERDGSWVKVELPAGPKARLLLLHICSLAIKRQSPIVEVGDSFSGFVRQLGFDTSGRNLRTFREQTRRMSCVNIRLAKNYGQFVDVFQGPIFSKLRASWSQAPGQRLLWPDAVELSPEFYESLRNNAVPLRHEAISALRHSSRALDIYSWLAHRLWQVKKPTRIGWFALQEQFGNRNHRRKTFQRAFKAALSQVKMVYPDAQVELGEKGGLVIRNSRPPVPFKTPAVLL